MQPHFPLVSLITVQYDHLSDTVEFLESAKALTYPNVEIIVVDNNSPNEKPSEEVKRNFPHVHFIQNTQNLGFAGGNNAGLKEAHGEYFFLLNNDTILPPDLLEPIIHFMETHADAGMASPKVLYADKVTVQYAGARSISPLTGRGKRLGLLEKDTGQYDRNYKTDLGHGAALIIPKKVADLVGPMPELYFLYYEEHDWCEQVKRLGYSMYYIGESHILHKESISTGGGESPLKVYYLTRNRLLFMRRNFSGLPFLLGLLFFIFLSTPKALVTYLVKGKPQLMKSFLSGIWWNVC
ncbi:MAG TPA: glycosyltransferase family 2 protein [Cyclobacteriaceae bacterium]|nr:glycosyltransferase family 2 protein [Cyclobacteriaceae bacterium]